MIEAQSAHFIGTLKRTIYTTYIFSNECNKAPRAREVPSMPRALQWMWDRFKTSFFLDIKIIIFFRQVVSSNQEDSQPVLRFDEKFFPFQRWCDRINSKSVALSQPSLKPLCVYVFLCYNHSISWKILFLKISFIRAQKT